MKEQSDIIRKPASNAAINPTASRRKVEVRERGKDNNQQLTIFRGVGFFVGT